MRHTLGSLYLYSRWYVSFLLYECVPTGIWTIMKCNTFDESFCIKGMITPGADSEP